MVSSDLASIEAAYINLGDIGLIPTAELKKYGCRTARLPLSDEQNFIHLANGFLQALGIG